MNLALPCGARHGQAFDTPIGFSEQYKRAFLKKTKDVKSYSNTDLSQILGYSVPASETDKSLIAKDSIAQYAKGGDEDGGKKQKKKKGKSESKSSDSEDSESESEAVASKPEPAKQRPAQPLPKQSVLKGMLVNMFSPGGFLGQKEDDIKEQDWKFDDATMEKIAVDAHASKAQGRGGLGLANDKPSKLGKDYTGSKKKFDSDDEGDGEDQAGEGTGKRKSKEESDDSEDEAAAKKKARKEARKAEKKAAKKDKEAGSEDDETSKKSKKDKKRKLKESKSFVEPEVDGGEKEKKKKKDKLKSTKSFP
jgi:hypothetical protein